MFRPLPFILVALGPFSFGSSGSSGSTVADPGQEQDAPGTELLDSTLAESGLRIDLERGLCAIPVRMLVRDDLLEYLLVGERGATHESLFVTDVRPSLLAGALLTLGVEPGTNARWEELPRDEAATDEPENQRPEYRVLLPEGDGFLLYAAWRERGETYLYRIDDLVSNLETGRSMRRHRWVYLGSRFKSRGEDEPEVFVADLEQNLINLSFFYQGNTLLTAALEECRQQTIWLANSWLLPPRGAPLELVFARHAIDRLPESWVETLPRIEPEAPSEQEGGEQSEEEDAAGSER